MVYQQKPADEHPAPGFFPEWRGFVSCYSTRLAVFEIALPSRQSVWMSVDETSFGMDRSAIVMVDAERLLSLWRRTASGRFPQDTVPFLSDWTDDYKFLSAEDGFSQGRANPVPLAHVTYHIQTRTSRVLRSRLGNWCEIEEAAECFGFINGITRTIWLFHYGAQAFPVVCSVDDANGLAKAAGRERDYVTKADLFGLLKR